jgi:threonine dehydrogenase-like Zn-dependent dehydrogenase
MRPGDAVAVYGAGPVGLMAAHSATIMGASEVYVVDFNDDRVKRYNAELRDLIIEGRAEPGFIVSHELPLAEAPSAYANFDQRVNGWTKVLLKP